jgi:hypothetical protein
MTEAERKKRGEKSAVIVERLVRAQLRAMGCDRFDPSVSARCWRDDPQMKAKKQLWTGSLANFRCKIHFPGMVVRPRR